MPSEFETWVKAKSFTSGVSSDVELIERQSAVIAHRHKTQPRAGSFGEQLPRHEIAVMLHLREQDHSPSRINFPPQACATRLMLSVVPRVKTISSALAAPM